MSESAQREGPPEARRDTDAPADGVETSGGRRRLVPLLGVWVIVTLCVAAAAWIRVGYVTGDHGAVNVLTLVCGLIAVVALGIWFVLFSGYARRTRLLMLLGVVALVATPSAVLEVANVSGELVPTFRFRWTKAPDELLAIPSTEEPASAVDLLTTTEHDFPQFLGPGRDLRVDNIVLNRDWSAHPPRELWRQPIGAGWSAFAVVNGFAVTMEQRGEEELVTCYAVRTGELIWAQGVTTRHATTAGGVGPRSTPTIHEGKVYSLGATGALCCLDGSTGTVLWSDDILNRYGVDPEEDEKGVAWGRSASPLVVDDLVVVPAGGPKGGPYVSLAAFDKETGELAWEGGDRQVSYASPVLATLGGVRQILSVNEDNVTAHEPSSGRILWSYDWPGRSTSRASVSQPVAVGDDRVLLSKAYGGGAALLQVQPSSGHTFLAQNVWHNPRLLKTKFTNVVVHDGHVYGLSDGILECVDLASGQRHWKRGRYGHGQLLGVGGLLLVQAESGEVALVEATPKRFAELGSFPALDDETWTWNNLCLFGRLLLVRNAQQAACYELH